MKSAKSGKYGAAFMYLGDFAGGCRWGAGVLRSQC